VELVDNNFLGSWSTLLKMIRREAVSFSPKKPI